MAQVFILVEGSAVDAAKVETALRPAGVLTPVGATRGLGNGATYDAIQSAVGCGRAYVGHWRARFLEQGVAGM